MLDNNNISKIVDTMNEVVISLTALLNELDKEIVKLTKEIERDNA